MSSVLSHTDQRASEDTLGRWFFTFIAAEFLIVSMIGFAPNSIAILTGAKANPPPIIHVHAALMFGWMVGFLAQAYLISVGKVRQHIQAGRILFGIGLTVLLTLIYFSLFWPGEGFGRINTAMTIDRVGFFSLFLFLAFFNRRRDSESHKRYILLATLVPLDAGLNRIAWLPSFGLAWATPPWMLLALSQLFLFDWLRLRRIHNATLFGGGLIAVFWLGMIVWLVFFA